MLISAAVAAGLTALGFLAATKRSSANTSSPSSPPPSSSVAATIGSLIDPPAPPVDVDPALFNLLCAPGVSQAELGAYLKTLDEWATAIGDNTRRSHHRYVENPKEFASEAEWKLAMMCTVIGQDFGVRYDPALATTTQLNSSNQQFFARSAPVFLSGCLGPERTGTCASLPVLYVALGRRLGYPMYLVAAKNHLFARWDDGQGTRVNIEAANAGGFTTHPDAHYRTWPFPITPNEEKSRGYLQNLDPSGMLAVFLGNRVQCLMASGNRRGAAIAAASAYRLAPELAGGAECLQIASGISFANSGEYANLKAENERLRNTLINMAGPPDPSPYLPPPGIPVPAAPVPVIPGAPGTNPYQPGYPIPR